MAIIYLEFVLAAPPAFEQGGRAIFPPQCNGIYLWYLFLLPHLHLSREGASPFIALLRGLVAALPKMSLEAFVPFRRLVHEE